MKRALARKKITVPAGVKSFFASVVPSARLGMYVAFGSVLWVVAAIVPAWIVFVLMFDAILIFIALMDLVLSPRPGDFEVWREFHDKMNLGAPNAVTISVKSRAGLPMTVTVRDEPPTAWPIQNDEAPQERDGVPLPPLPRVHIRVEPGREAAARYRLTPTRRGDFRFGPLSTRFTSVLGLWHRQFVTRPAEGSSHARVYPDTSEVRRYEMALRENKLQNAGLHILRLRGRGTEFESLREYNTDDEYKSINWKASAKRGKLIATNYEIERDQTIVICLDCGRMMTSMAVSKGSGGRGQGPGADGGTSTAVEAEVTPLSKLDCAINATVLLAHVAASMGDAVGLMLFSDSVLRFIPPRKGRVQTGTIIEALYAAQPSLVEPDYQAAYEYLMARKLRRALVVTFTDIIDPEASRELLNASAAMRRHHNALCVTINNRDVMEMAHLLPQNSGQLYEKAMAQRMLAQRQSALEQLRGLGVGILDVEAVHLTIAAVNRYLDLKSRGTL